MYPKWECLLNTNNAQRYEKFLTCARKMRKDRDFLFFFKNILWNEKKAVPLHTELCANVIKVQFKCVFY